MRRGGAVMAERMQWIRVEADRGVVGDTCDECSGVPVVVWVAHARLCRACAERLIGEIREAVEAGE